MKTLIRGEKVKLQQFTTNETVIVETKIDATFAIDFTCFGLDSNRQLTDDRYMIFYNQLSTPEKAMMLDEQLGQSAFTIHLNKLPSSVSYLVFTATIDGEQTMRQINSGSFVVNVNGQSIIDYTFKGQDFQNQKAIVIGEVYNKDGWRVASIGQGFDGGLEALLNSFGGVAEQVSAPQPIVNDKKVLLEKRMAKEAPYLLDLSKKASVSLEKVGLQQHVAKVALCLDISGSMVNLYRSKKIQHFLERILALGTRFDDDGAIDIFLFGKNAYDAGELNISNSRTFLNRLMKDYPLEGSTFYSKAITLIRKHYIGSSSHRRKPSPLDVPVYVMFVTDGDTFDREQTTKQIVNASYEPIFWQFMAIDETKKTLFGRTKQSQFTYLEQLDTLDGRYVDNAGFFVVHDPSEIPDEQLYDLLMSEYPQWVKVANVKGLVLA
jgi:stress response protein SCP2